MYTKPVTNPDGSPGVEFFAEPGDHIVRTGPVSGIKTLADGTTVDIGPELIAVESLEHAAEVAHLIGLHHAENGHPHDVDHLLDPESGKRVPVQRPFVYLAPDGTDSAGNAKFKAHIGDVGYAHGEHPLDEVNGITAEDADPRVLAHRSTKRKGS